MACNKRVKRGEVKGLIMRLRNADGYEAESGIVLIRTPPIEALAQCCRLSIRRCGAGGDIALRITNRAILIEDGPDGAEYVTRELLGDCDGEAHVVGSRGVGNICSGDICDRQIYIRHVLVER